MLHQKLKKMSWGNIEILSYIKFTNEFVRLERDKTEFKPNFLTQYAYAAAMNKNS